MHKIPQFNEVRNKGNVHLRTFTVVEVDIPNNWNKTMQKYAWNLLMQEADRLGFRFKGGS